MELAASAFNAAVLPGFGRGRAARGNSEQASSQQAASRRSASEQSAINPDKGRVIDGEVLAKQSEVYTPPRQNPSFQAAGSSFTQAENRRFSPQAAISMFRQNEATLTDNTQSRQVSGIIDIYV